MEKTDFDTENLINAVQNENSLWDTTLNANEEDTELSWKRIVNLFGQPNGLHIVT